MFNPILRLPQNAPLSWGQVDSNFSGSALSINTLEQTVNNLSNNLTANVGKGVAGLSDKLAMTNSDKFLIATSSGASTAITWASLLAAISGTPLPTAWGALTGTLSNQADLQSALNSKVNYTNPTITGTLTANSSVGIVGQVLTSGGAGSPAIWTTVSGSGSTTWGSITGTLASQIDLQNALNLKPNTSSLGTAAYVNTGTTANTIVKLDGSARLPAVDGSQLINLPSSAAGVSSFNTRTGAVTLQTSDVTAALISPLPIANGGTAATSAAGARTSLGLGTSSTLNSGISAYNAVQLDGSARLPAVDGSQLINLPSSVAGVSSFNTRTGAVSLTGTDVVGALGYTPLANVPIASATVLGGIKVGTGLSIDGSGVLSASGAAGVSSFNTRTGAVTLQTSDVTNVLSTGLPVANGGTSSTSAAGARLNLATGGLADTNTWTGLNNLSSSAYLRTSDYLWINPTNFHAGWPIGWQNNVAFIATGNGSGGTTLGSGVAGGKTPGVFAVRASQAAPGSMYIGLTFLGIQDLNAAVGWNTIYGFYGETYKEANCDYRSLAQGFELDIINRHSSGPGVVDPYQANGEYGSGVGITEGIRIGTGQLGTQTQYHCSDALLIAGAASSGIGWLRGINFNQDAIAPGGSAISMAAGQTIQYFGAANTPTSQIRCDGTTSNGGTRLIFADGATYFQSVLNGNVFAIGTNGVLQINTATATTANAIQKYLPIIVNGVTYKLALLAA